MDVNILDFEYFKLFIQLFYTKSSQGNPFLIKLLLLLIIRYLLTISLFLSYTLSYSQQVEIPQNFGNWMTVRNFINPAITGKEGGTNFQITHAGFTGLRKNINTSYISFYKSYGQAFNGTQKQSIGLSFYTDHPGKYTSKNKFHLLYSYRLSLNKKTTLSMGGALGLYNYFIKDNPSAIIGSSTSPDGAIGLQLEMKKNTALEIALHQFTSSIFQPAKAFIQLKPFVTSSFSHIHKLNKNAEIEIGGLHRNLGKSIQNDFSIYSLYSKSFRNITLYGGVNYKGRYGVNCLAITDILIKNKYVKVGLSYHINTSKYFNTSTNFQINLSFNIPNGSLIPYDE